MAETVNQTGVALVDGDATGEVPGHGLSGGGEKGLGPPGPALARWLWPPRCLVCRSRGAGGMDLCQACTDALPWLGAACIRCAIPLQGATPGLAAVCGACLQHPPPLAETHAACLYGPPLDRNLGLPLLGDLLHRVRDTAPQSRLEAVQRQRNLKDAFRIAGTTALPVHVVLVDDVMTTGATLLAAADGLRRAGVARVDAWVCARVP